MLNMCFNSKKKIILKYLFNIVLVQPTYRKGKIPTTDDTSYTDLYTKYFQQHKHIYGDILNLFVSKNKGFLDKFYF